MTLLIAAKAGPGLRPNGTNFRFEPGVVIAADTRLSYPDGTYSDDGLKVGITGASGICGMASDSIDIPTQAFYDFDGLMANDPNISALDAVRELRCLLTKAHDSISDASGNPTLNTNVFFGHCDPSTKQLSLYRLDSDDRFLPKIRDGFNAAGSHADSVLFSFGKIKGEYPKFNLKPFDGFPDNIVPVQEGTAVLVMWLIQSALQIADSHEAETLQMQAIGGAAQGALITSDGPIVYDPKWNESLRAWQVHERRLG